MLYEIGDAELESLARLRAAEQLIAEGRRAEADEQLQRSLAFWRSRPRDALHPRGRGAARRGVLATAAYSAQRSGTPFSSCSPRSSNEMPDPATRSRTVRVTSTSSGSDNADTRAAMCTAMPAMPASRRITSPACSPQRTCNPRALNLVTDVPRAADGAGRAVERGEDAVACGVLQPARRRPAVSSARPARTLPGQPANRDRRAHWRARWSSRRRRTRRSRGRDPGPTARDREPVTNSSIAPSSSGSGSGQWSALSSSTSRAPAMCSAR